MECQGKEVVDSGEKPECIKEYEYHSQIVELLEELKAYKQQHLALCEHYDVNSIEDIYFKAIDDFAEKLKTENEKYDIDDVFESSDVYSYTSACYIFENYVEKIAEQLKIGGENDN